MEMVHLLMAPTDITEQRNGQGREGNLKYPAHREHEKNFCELCLLIWTKTTDHKKKKGKNGDMCCCEFWYI
jgi:hypothetical protein